jgi:hypothetical protein
MTYTEVPEVSRTVNSLQQLTSVIDKTFIAVIISNLVYRRLVFVTFLIRARLNTGREIFMAASSVISAATYLRTKLIFAGDISLEASETGKITGSGFRQ